MIKSELTQVDLSTTDNVIYAPIVFFVYNRPWHTQQAIEALQKNELAKESDLFIFSDAPKTLEAAPAVQEVRDYIRRIKGFKTVSIVERKKNLGLANSIIDGVTKVCNEFGRVIVLEDDLVTSPYFLRFMNEALDLYEHEGKIISIHGYIYPVSKKLPETFFLRGADCWGWATWRKGWDLFEPDGGKLLDKLKITHSEEQFDFDGTYGYLKMLKAQVRGRNSSWAIRWYASAFLNNKLTLYPGKSLVLNIGNDDSGTHSVTTKKFSGDIADRPIAVGGVQIIENSEARSAIAQYFASNKVSLTQRAIQKFVRIVGKNWPQWSS